VLNEAGAGNLREVRHREVAKLRECAEREDVVEEGVAKLED
jgi:hypothetical protein